MNNFVAFFYKGGKEIGKFTDICGAGFGKYAVLFVILVNKIGVNVNSVVVGFIAKCNTKCNGFYIVLLLFVGQKFIR